MDTSENTPSTGGNDADTRNENEGEQAEHSEALSDNGALSSDPASPSDGVVEEQADASSYDTAPDDAAPDVEDAPTLKQPAAGPVPEPAPVSPLLPEAFTDSALPPEEPTLTLPAAPSDWLNGTRPADIQADIQREADDIADWPAFIPPSRPLRDPRTVAVERRWNRRRRRYALYVRRTTRARQAHRTRIITRATWLTVSIMLLLIFSVLAGTIAAAASYYNSEANLLHGLQRGIAAKDSVRIYDDKGTLLYQLDAFGAQHSIPLAQVPVNVVNATVAIEDHDFWINNGIDFTSIVRAATDDLKTGHISQGGSTITQQLIKEQILGGDVNFQRKLNEAILSIGITETGTYSKSQILQMYLDSIPYSPTSYGIDAAAQEYFGYKDDPATGETAAQQLDLAQASMLAGIPQNPNLNDPLLHPQSAHTRQGEVLKAMVQYGYITPAQANAAWQESLQKNFYHHVTTEQNLAPHFVYYVIDQIQQMIDTGQLKNLDRSGLNIYTTLDMGLQNQAQQAMKDHLYGNDQAGYGGLIRNSNVSNSAEIIAQQSTGAIKVYLGSIDYYSTKIDGKFDVVSQGRRGPGSSFKPFVYATALEKGWFPAQTIGDIPTEFWDSGTETAYKPLDFDTSEMNAEVTLRTALDWSLNVPAVKVMQYAGVNNVRTQVERMGITQWDGTWGLSSALGSLDVSPFEMAQAYTVFANYGQFIPLHAIDSISDSAGNVLFKYVVPQPVQVMDPRVAFLMTSILSDNASRAGDFGPCAPLYLDEYHGPGVYQFGSGGDNAAADTSECGAIYANHFLSSHAWPTAAKTGTGQDFTDDWTMGYTMDYTAAVWVGNNNHSPMYNIDGVTGAAPIFYASMLYAEESQNLPKRPFPVPSGVHQAKYCSNSVCTTDWFLNGAMPPNNTGENAPSVPCVTVLPQGGWNYGPPCNIGLASKIAKNNGAPPPVTINGQQYVGGLW